jgi:hypothetical protein
LSHGSLVKAGPLAEAIRLPGAGKAMAIWYTSLDFAGRPTVVSGSLTLPAGRAPAGGWPVVSFGHGQGGTADACAQSRIGQGEMEAAVLRELLAAGYAVAVSDYPGIGTRGDATIIDGPSEGRALIDIVLAARRIAPLSRTWVSVGYSLGGHAALFAASMASQYAPSLNHAGTITLAGLTQLRALFAGAGQLGSAAPLNAQVPFMMHGLETTHPGQVELGQYLTPVGSELLAAAGRICLPEMVAAVAPYSYGDVLADPAAVFAAFATWYEEEEIPVAKYDRPIRMVHGLDDEIPAVLSEITAGQLAAAGSDASYLPVAGADHVTLPHIVAPQVVTWVGEYVTAAR